MTTYVVISPGGHYHDATRDRRLAERYLVVEYEAWERWYTAARWAGSVAEDESALAILPPPVAAFAAFAEAQAETDRLNAS